VRIPVWVSEAAAAFWAAAGGPEPFPRRLRGPIARSAFDVTIKELPGLTARGAARYLAGLGVPWGHGGPNRPLRACLAAWDGAGFILLDAEDGPEEQTFSLAHELAHFLRHYWAPRQRACRRLGEGAAAVLDGRRAPTPAQRVDALLGGVALSLHVHLMERGPRRELLSQATAVAEEEADRLAYELLAPAAAVAGRVAEMAGTASRGRLAEILRTQFGLPAAPAEDYALALLPEVPADPLLRDLFGASSEPRPSGSDGALTAP
jgi:hypothetical protein